MIVSNDIERAEKRLSGILHRTPLVPSSMFSRLAGSDILLKCENMQKTGSFKVRGAYNKIALLPEDASSVVAASAGNHAQGVAYAASLLSRRSVVVMPRSAPLAKLEATRGYGAEVILHGDYFDDAFEMALRLRDDTGAALIHAYDDEDIIAGQGTVALEILREAPDTGAVLIPAGGGGLLAGMAIAIKAASPRVRVIGVQARGCDPLARSFESGVYSKNETAATIADGIAIRAPGEQTLHYINKYVDDILTVTDDELAETMLLLLERCKLVVEPSGAAALAAAAAGAAGLSGMRAVCVLTGGNVDVGMLHTVVARGLVARGRRVRLRTVVPDLPGNLARLSSAIASCGANIIAADYDKLRPGLRLGETQMRITCEVTGPEHARELTDALSEIGYELEFD